MSWNTYRLSSDRKPGKHEDKVTVYGPILKTIYPCCNGTVRLRTTKHIPKEVYDRKCPNCGTMWNITRQLVKDDGAVRLDTLVWESAHVELYAKNRCSLIGK